MRFSDEVKYSEILQDVAYNIELPEQQFIVRYKGTNVGRYISGSEVFR